MSALCQLQLLVAQSTEFDGTRFLLENGKMLQYCGSLKKYLMTVSQKRPYLVQHFVMQQIRISAILFSISCPTTLTQP